MTREPLLASPTAASNFTLAAPSGALFHEAPGGLVAGASFARRPRCSKKWALGGRVGYDFVGPRFEVEGMYHYNTGSTVVAFPTGYANVTGRIDQLSVMANVL